jgi:hypothetical protein
MARHHDHTPSFDLKRRFRWKGFLRRAAARLGVIALLVQCLVAATHLPASAASPFSDPAAWCFSGDTPSGFDLPGQTVPKPPHKLPPCPICQSLQAAAGVLPAAMAETIAPYPTGSIEVQERDAAAPSGVWFLAARPRAPPVAT